MDKEIKDIFMKNSNCNNLSIEEPLVTIQCLVYNQKYFLRDCLDGFVMQKTNFPFEAIIHDDASTDGSADIIREYAEKYPNIIKPIYEKENQYSKKNGSLTKIMNATCNGKYIAFCEGDDYWIDPYKLQKQVDYMESHLDIGLCYTNFNILNYNTKDIRHDVFTSFPREFHYDHTLGDWIREAPYIGPMTWLARSGLWKSVIRVSGSVDGSFCIIAYFKKYSKTVCLLNETTAVYRIHDGSATQTYEIRKSYDYKSGLHNLQLMLADMYLENESFFSKDIIDRNYYCGYLKMILLLGEKKEIAKIEKYKNSLSGKRSLIYKFCESKFGLYFFQKYYSIHLKRKYGFKIDI